MTSHVRVSREAQIGAEAGPLRGQQPRDLNEAVDGGGGAVLEQWSVVVVLGGHDGGLE